MKPVRAVVLLVGLVLLLSVLLYAETAEITTWTIPTSGSLPAGVAVAQDGTVYFTEYTGEKIGHLDPATNRIQERSIVGNPKGIVVVGDNSVYYGLPTAAGIGLLVFDGGGNFWELPGGSVDQLVKADSGPGSVNLWFNERMHNKVGRFSPSQVVVNTLFVNVPRVFVEPQIIIEEPIIRQTDPQHFPGNPALPPPVAAVPGVTSGPYTQWDVMNTSGYLEGVTIAPDGNVWLSNGADQLVRLNVGTSSMLFYDLPSGTKAVKVAPNQQGKIWFTDISMPAIGRLDPETGNVTLWGIGGGTQPLDLQYHNGSIWFVDREEDAICRLDRDANQIATYYLDVGSHPVDLEVTDDGTVWFVCERGNIVGRIKLEPSVTPPTDTGLSCDIISASALKIGKKARIAVTYQYDGSFGFPVYLRAMASTGNMGQVDFYCTPAEITEAGTHISILTLVYTGSAPLDTDHIDIVFYKTIKANLCQKSIDFNAHWMP